MSYSLHIDSQQSVPFIFCQITFHFLEPVSFRDLILS
uniref:Uncharacterized protein n=1 Tax=Manihot esculenta TaxID=3983 RepID=A0A2C9WDM7_MANES